MMLVDKLHFVIVPALSGSMPLPRTDERQSYSPSTPMVKIILADLE